MSVDVNAVVLLTRDRDAWQGLALRALDVLANAGSAKIENRRGQHDAQMSDIERALIQQALASCTSHAEAARFLGLRYKTLRYKVKALGITQLHEVEKSA